MFPVGTIHPYTDLRTGQIASFQTELDVGSRAIQREELRNILENPEAFVSSSAATAGNVFGIRSHAMALREAFFGAKRMAFAQSNETCLVASISLNNKNGFTQHVWK